MMTQHTQLTPRDIELFDWLNRHSAATCRQIAHEFFGSESRAYKRLLGLRKRNFVRADRDLTALPAVYRVTEAGAGLSACELSAPKKNLPQLVHTVELVELYQTLLQEDESIEEYYTERELRRREREETEEKRAADGTKKLSRIPDGFIVDFMGRNIALELELVPKRAPNYKRIFRAYEDMLSSGRYDSIRYYVRSPEAARRLERIAFSRHSFEEGQISFCHYTPLHDANTAGQSPRRHTGNKKGTESAGKPGGHHTPASEVEVFEVETFEEDEERLLQCSFCGTYWWSPPHEVCEDCGRNLRQRPSPRRGG